MTIWEIVKWEPGRENDMTENVEPQIYLDAGLCGSPGQIMALEGSRKRELRLLLLARGLSQDKSCNLC